MRMFILLSDGDTWDGVENCRVILAKEEHELTAEEIEGFGEYNPKNHIEYAINLSELAEDVFDLPMDGLNDSTTT